jgi:hypothetical protein
VNAREVDIKESILMTGMEYSILKEKIEDSECGWSDGSGGHRASSTSPFLLPGQSFCRRPKNGRAVLPTCVLVAPARIEWLDG